MIISASQLKTYRRCPRLWWFEKQRKMPALRERAYGFTFGQVLHAVIERWLRADPAGRDPMSGEPVDLYPPGWELDEEGHPITEMDQEHIKSLLSKAIEEGLLQRRPGRQVEWNFTVPIVPNVVVTGFIDLALPAEVQDHKSTKNMRYALSKKKLAEDLQLKLYAKVLADTQALEEGAEVTIRHNVFCSTELTLRKTEVRLPVVDLHEHWDGLAVTAQEMKDLKDSGYQDSHWQAVEDNFPEACSAYGGCRFLMICSGRETPAKFRERYARLTAVNPETAPEPIGLCLLHNCNFEKKGKLPGRTWTIAELFDYVVTSGGNSLEEYYSKDAFKRRDVLRGYIPEVLEALGDCWVAIPHSSSLDPDEKALVAALRTHASIEVSARGA